MKIRNQTWKGKQQSSMVRRAKLNYFYWDFKETPVFVTTDFITLKKKKSVLEFFAFNNLRPKTFLI